MKVISLIEPWASLVAQKLKHVETRSWPTNYRGELYIHASAKIPKWAKLLCRKFAEVLRIPEYEGSWLYYLEHGIGPFGKIIAKCRLVDCLPIRDIDIQGETAYADGSKGCWYMINGKEYHFGDYTPGRWAWILQDIERLENPIPAKGKLGIWNFEVVEDSHGER